MSNGLLFCDVLHCRCSISRCINSLRAPKWLCQHSTISLKNAFVLQFGYLLLACLLFTTKPVLCMLNTSNKFLALDISVLECLHFFP